MKSVTPIPLTLIADRLVQVLLTKPLAAVSGPILSILAKNSKCFANNNGLY